MPWRRKCAATPDVFASARKSRVPGRLQGHPGCCRNSARRADPTHDQPSTVIRRRRASHRDRRPQAIVEFMTFNFRPCRRRQIINSAAKTLYMSGGQMACSVCSAGPPMDRRRVSGPTQPGLFMCSACAGPYCNCAVHGRGRQGPAQIRHPYPNPVVSGNEILYGHSFPCRK